MDDLEGFLAVARAGGFRQAARGLGVSASGLSEAIRRLELRLGVRLLHRTTRSVAPTQAGLRLMGRLGAAYDEIEAALREARSLAGEPAGVLRLNVPASAARLVLPRLLPAFLAAHPRIEVEVSVEESFVDVLAAGCDAGVRYEERLDQDMIAVPLGPRTQRFACGASPAYLDRAGRPSHPRDLTAHACMRGRFASGNALAWQFERGDETVRVDPVGPLLVQLGGASDLLVDAAIAGLGVVYHFEDWLRPHFLSGGLAPVLEDWWPRFSGPFLYYPGRRLVPAPLRAFVDFVKAAGEAMWRAP
jgi:DNA-binding transcriptional LysR family regulator